jgi:MOSC domain-containing protein YiiM
MPGFGRQLTLISQEYIDMISHYLGVKPLHPNTLRRNLPLKNINLSALRYQQFQIGDAIFEAGALCHPCQRIEAAFARLIVFKFK